MNIPDPYIFSEHEAALEFRDWQDDEGGLMGLMLSHGVEVFPEEMRNEAEIARASYEQLHNSFGAYLKKYHAEW